VFQRFSWQLVTLYASESRLNLKDPDGLVIPLNFCAGLVFTSSAAAVATTATAAATTTALVSAATARAATTTATAEAAATAATAIESTAAATTTFGLGPGFIHVQAAVPQLGSVGSRNCLFCLFIVGHLHKAEAARLTGIAFLHDGDVIHLPISCECASQFIFGDVVIEIAYINIFRHRPFFMLRKQLRVYWRDYLIRAVKARVAGNFLLHG
jgi:hypothetical protein